MTQRDVYVAKMKLQLDELNASLSALELKAEQAKVDGHAQMAEQLKRLRHESKAAGERFDALKAAGEDAWEGLVAQMDSTREAFVRSFHYFKSQL